MAKLMKFQILTGMLIIFRIDANIEIIQTGTEIRKTGTGKCCNECGENFTLTCRIKTYSSYMAWQIDPDPIPISECFDDTCTLNPNAVGQYSLSTNTTLGIFNLIFLDFDLDFNTTVFKCGDGTTTESSDIFIRDYRPFLVENVTNELQVNSGCIHNFTNVLVEWIKMKYKDGGKEEETFTPSDPKEGKDLTSCSLDTTCGRNDLMKVTTLISIEQLDNSDGYYVQAVLTYDKVYTMKSAWSTGRYKIEDSCSRACFHVIMQLVAIGAFIFGVFLFCCFADSLEKHKGCTIFFHLIKLAIWGLALLGFILAWIICRQMDHCLCCKIAWRLRFVYLALISLHFVFVVTLVIIGHLENVPLKKDIMALKLSWLPALGILYIIYLIYKTSKTEICVSAIKIEPLVGHETDDNCDITSGSKSDSTRGSTSDSTNQDASSKTIGEVETQGNVQENLPPVEQPGNNMHDPRSQNSLHKYMDNITHPTIERKRTNKQTPQSKQNKYQDKSKQRKQNKEGKPEEKPVNDNDSPKTRKQKNEGKLEENSVNDNDSPKTREQNDEDKPEEKPVNDNDSQKSRKRTNKQTSQSKQNKYQDKSKQRKQNNEGKSEEKPVNDNDSPKTRKQKNEGKPEEKPVNDNDSPKPRKQKHEGKPEEKPVNDNDSPKTREQNDEDKPEEKPVNDNDSTNPRKQKNEGKPEEKPVNDNDSPKTREQNDEDKPEEKPVNDNDSPNPRKQNDEGKPEEQPVNDDDSPKTREQNDEDKPEGKPVNDNDSPNPSSVSQEGQTPERQNSKGHSKHLKVKDNTSS